MSLSNHEAKEEELHFKSIDNALSNYGCYTYGNFREDFNGA